MKLFQALKLKNKLVGEINNKKSLILQKNSITLGEKNYYNSKQLLEELIQYIKDLNTLKVAINLANFDIQQSIYEIAEAKSFLSFIKSINTTEGKIKGGGRFSGEIENDFIVGINEAEKNKFVSEYQILVDLLQDKIDIYNHSSECVVDEKSFLINK